MKGFRFRLEAVLAVRKHREETLQCELAEAQRVLEAEMAALESITAEMRERALNSVRGRQLGPVDVSVLAVEDSYQELLRKRLVAQTARVEQQKQRVSDAREMLLQASRDKKALETYRENELASFAKEMSRKEQRGAEETAGVLHLLRQVGAQRP